MAEQVTNDVVKEAQSVGRPAPIDDTASTTSTPAVNGEPLSGPAITNSYPLKATSTAPHAIRAGTGQADSAHVSEPADGEAAPVSRRGTPAELLLRGAGHE